MDKLLNIDDINLLDILRQLDFKASIQELNDEFALEIEIVDNEENILFSTTPISRSENNKIKLCLSKRRIGSLYFEAKSNENFLKSYLTSYFTEQVKLGYKIYLTNDIHLKLAEESYNELSEKNDELTKANKALKELDKIKTNFLAMISHELKTPLTSIIGYTEFLQLEDFDEETEETLDKILNNALELHNLIKQILEITKIEEGALRLNKKEVNINKLIEEILSGVNYQLINKNIEIDLNMSISQDIIIIDEEKIYQTIRNLLTNAIKFSEKNSKITLNVEEVTKLVESDDPESSNFTFFGAEEDYFLKISVIDSGIGISEANQEKLFNSFYQVDGTQTRDHGGTGLGLSIVKNFIIAHKGTYGLQSELGKGSNFWIELPY